MKEKYLTKQNIRALAVLVLYIVFNLILLMRHEMWRDEINVWLMGRDLSVPELFREIKYQGHPCLWYLLIMPFAKLGFSCRIMGIISLMVMTAAAGLYLYKAPIPFWIKAVSLFGPMFTYHYSINARGYCLVALLVILLAWSYRKRNTNPLLYGVLLGLLVQADTIALPVAGMISLMWLGENAGRSFREKTVSWLLTAARGLWIPLLSLFLWIAQFYQVSDSPVFAVQPFGAGELVTGSADFAVWIVERLTGMPGPAILVFYLLTGGSAVVLSIGKKKFWPLPVMLGSLLFQCVFSLMVYELYITHFISLCFVFIWMIWVLCDKEEVEETEEKRIVAGKAAGYVLQGAFLVFVGFLLVKWSSPEEAFGIRNAWSGLVSDGENAAVYLEENLSADELIVTVNVPYTSTIWGFAKQYKTYFAGSGEAVSYADWSEEQTREISFEELLNWVKDRFPEKDSFILVSSPGSYLKEAEEGLAKAQILYRTQESTIKQEEYVIYRVQTN